MGHGHDHGHRHGHGQSHAPADFGRAFAIGITLNAGFVFVEGLYGFLSGSMALLADAGHNLSDVLGLIVAWAGTKLAKRPPSKQFTYGLRGSSILAALINALLLMVAVGAIAWEALRRIADPQPVEGATVIVVAAIGIVVNGATALLFARGRRHDINIRGAFLHMTADAAVSAGVVAAGLIILTTGALWVDPAVSLIIAVLIFLSSWSLLRDSVRMSLDAVPGGIDIDEVRAEIATSPGVAAIQDLHVWPMSTTEAALTAHLVMPAGHPGDGFLAEISERLHRRFHIGHSTIQIVTEGSSDCGLHRH